jgi:CRP-like cAMP-binding protein
MQEEEFGEGGWILRQGDANAGLRVILEGEVTVEIGGIDRAVLHAGMFFGEISVLLDQPVGASVVSRTPLRCAHIHRDDLIRFLLENPTVTLRLLQAEARRVDDANRWML